VNKTVSLSDDWVDVSITSSILESVLFSYSYPKSLFLGTVSTDNKLVGQPEHCITNHMFTEPHSKLTAFFVAVLSASHLVT
jgi:hypothetical protein